MKGYRVGMLSHKIIMWAGTLFFLFCAVMSYSTEIIASLLFMFFAGMAIFELVTLSHLKFTNKAISVFSPFTEYRMRWDEIDRIEYGGLGTLVLYGTGNERLVVPPTSAWSGSQKYQARKYLAEFKFHKNVKVAISKR